LILILPIIAALVIALVYLRLFSSPVVIAIIFVAYVAVSLRNRRKFNREKEKRVAGQSRGRLFTLFGADAGQGATR
jgi:positive regulator of sigma E activity